MINAGFIGTGGISAAHLNYLKKRKDVNIAALCDINTDQVQKRQKEYGGIIFTDFRDMLNKTELDAVWICTPSTVRKELLLACADKGIPVFCEKPVERSVEKGIEIAEELKKRNAKVQIGYVFRFMPVIEALRKAIKDDSIHLIQSFYGCDISLAMSLAPWFYDKEKSGGGLVDQATHNFDLMRFLFGEVKEIHGMATNPVKKKCNGYTIDETIGLIFLFANGIIGCHTHTWVGDSWRNEIMISGEKCLYRLNPNTGSLVVEDAKKTLDLNKGKLVEKKQTGALDFEQDARSLYEYENECFLNQVTSDDWSHNLLDYEDGLKTLRFTIACDKAVACGKAKL